MYEYRFVSECFDLDTIMDGMDSKCCFRQPVCILYCLLSKAIHTGFAPGTITFSFWSATSTLALLLYAVCIDLNSF